MIDVNQLSRTPRVSRVSRVVFCVALSASLSSAACGRGERTKDTGAGANQAVPPTITCEDFCARLADCVVVLCNEDTKTMNYTGTAPIVEKTCLSDCADTDAPKLIPQEAWSCVFQSSCRMAFDYDDCHGFSTYTCH